MSAWALGAWAPGAWAGTAWAESGGGCTVGATTFFDGRFFCGEFFGEAQPAVAFGGGYGPIIRWRRRDDDEAEILAIIASFVSNRMEN